MAIKQREWKASKITVLILFILLLLTIARPPKFIFLHESKKSEAIRAFKKNCMQIGIASWYDENSAGSLTASGEKYDPKALTAAHRKFPFGTQLNVINLENDRSVTVRVNDRGPYLNNRIIDLSVEAAHRIGMEKPGLVAVCVQDAAKENKTK